MGVISIKLELNEFELNSQILFSRILIIQIIHSYHHFAQAIVRSIEDKTNKKEI